MKTTSFIQLGKRKTQQDALVVSEPLFAVCDGVGGSDNGDVASTIAVETLKGQITTGADFHNEIELIKTTQDIQRKMYQLVLDKSDMQGGSTTLAMVYIANKKATVAHIGDSRVYYYSINKNALWRTKDHSLVQSLFDQGHISADEMNSHPMRNRITRALSAKEKDFVKPEVKEISRLTKGDIFLLCSDGVTEAIKPNELENIIQNQEIGINDKIEIIKEKCTKFSNDNNTCIVIELEEKDVPNKAWYKLFN